MKKSNVKILAIESSCDETAAAVVEDGRKVLSNVISSQIDLHTIYGGVVPEIASRKHIENINFVIKDALKEANVTFDDIDAIAVTYGPGLVGALLVGVGEAKALAYGLNKPLIGVLPPEMMRQVRHLIRWQEAWDLGIPEVRRLIKPQNLAILMP